MPSSIDPTQPPEGQATTAAVRQNFQAAKDEIEAEQATNAVQEATIADLIARVTALENAPPGGGGTVNWRKVLAAGLTVSTGEDGPGLWTNTDNFSKLCTFSKSDIPECTAVQIYAGGELVYENSNRPQQMLSAFFAVAAGGQVMITRDFVGYDSQFHTMWMTDQI